MGLTEADAKALVNEGVLSADYDEHKEAIEFYDKALKIIETSENSLRPRIVEFRSNGIRNLKCYRP